MLIASIGFGFMNLAVKMMGHMHVSQVVFFRAVVQIVLGLAVLLQQKQSPFGKNPKMLFMRGFFGSMGLLCYFYTLQIMPLGNAIVIHYLSPILTTLLAFLLGDEIVKPRQWWFFGLSFLGVVVVNGLSNQVTWFGILAGIGGAVFSALTPPLVPDIVIPVPQPISTASKTPSLSSSRSKASLMPSPSESVQALIEVDNA
jgi:drug/metabolite transporter (DMT)-like permease